MSSSQKTAVRRHLYRCPGCGISTHQPGDVEDEKEINCTICGFDGEAEFVRSRPTVIDTHLVETGDEVILDYFSEDNVKAFGEQALDAAAVEANRECPVCLKQRVCSAWEAERVFMTSNWGATSMLDDAEKVCSYCFSVQIDGTWKRMKTVDSRAYELANAGGTKSSGHYRDILTRGIDTGEEPPAAEDADGW